MIRDGQLTWGFLNENKPKENILSNVDFPFLYVLGFKSNGYSSDKLAMDQVGR